MTANDIINITKEHASEYLEMSDNPDEFISYILANELVRMYGHIEYLERRIKNAV
jgi:hypothetical protein